MRVGIVGAGSLGGALARHLIHSQIIESEELFLSVRSDERIQKLKFEFPRSRIAIGIDPDFLPDVLVLSVKPQDFKKAAREIKEWCQYNPLIISMMSGVTIEEIATELAPTQRIIRTMPNLPFVFGEGTIGYFSSQNIKEEDVSLLKLLFETSGLLLAVNSEPLLDAVTAISASGPGYLAMLYRKTCDTVQEMGFDEDTADLLLRQTLQGFLSLLNNGLSPKEIEQLVTSKGGTTYAAIEVLKARKAPKIISEAMNAALLRARELGAQKE